MFHYVGGTSQFRVSLGYACFYFDSLHCYEGYRKDVILMLCIKLIMNLYLTFISSLKTCSLQVWKEYIFLYKWKTILKLITTLVDMLLFSNWKFNTDLTTPNLIVTFFPNFRIWLNRQISMAHFNFHKLHLLFQQVPCSSNLLLC